MLEQWEHISTDSLINSLAGALATLLFLSTILLYRSRSSFIKDIDLLGLGLRTLIRTGRAPQRIDIKNSSLETLWRKLLAFYAGMSRGGESKVDMLEVLSTSIGLAEAGDSEESVLRALTEVVLRSSYPEVKFVAAAISQHGRHWKVVSAAGISRDRLEDPLLIAVEALPLMERDLFYTRPQNGPTFDFRGLGVGMSLFVPMRLDGDIAGVVWLGFSEAAGTLPEARRATIEMIVRHAIASYHTARKSNARIELGLEQKEKMLSLSHDMKAPGMRALYALRELHQSATSLDDTNKNLLREAEYAVEEQLGLIQSLFSVETGRSDNGMLISPEIEIASFVKQRVESFRVVSRAVNIQLELGELERAKVRISREALCRILDNLISNAIKYTSEGVIHVSVSHLDKAVLVRVADTGKGVPVRLRPYLFSNAMREEQREVNSGQGYGLTVVKRLTEEYGGSVQYQPNTKTGGSIFSFSLPVTHFLEGALNKANMRKVALLIDDDAIVRSTHERWLSGMFDRIVSCASFEEARIVASLEQPSLILTDASIPGESLSDFIDSITFNCRIVILSGRPRRTLEDQYGLYPQVFSVLEKPIGKIDLQEVIRKIEFDDTRKVLERAA